jgi:hypothetical protein
MGIQQKLQYLLETKRLIKDAIVSKGVEVSDDCTFRDYVDKIRQIPPIESSYFKTTIKIDQSITDANGMVSVIFDDGGIEKIRENSHRYSCESINGKLYAKQIKDDEFIHVDGSDIDISKDIMMKLPRFYYKAYQLSDDDIQNNIWYIDFIYGVLIENATYMVWEGDEFIGVYEGYVIDDKLYSLTDVISSIGFTQGDGQMLARNRGNGYTLTTWKQHCIMAFLFLAWYKNTNSQLICGYGLDNYEVTTGDSNLLLMEDTIYNPDINQSINFWGLERWWGGRYEWMDNVTAGDMGGKWIVKEEDGNRILDVCVESGVPNVLLIGPHLDATAISVLGTSTTGYCDRYYSTHDSITNVARSGLLRNPYAGVFYIAARRDDEQINNDECTLRLSYKGEYELI